MRMIKAPRFHPDMELALLEGRKHCTTRSEPFGETGDTFQVGSKIFKIKEIRVLTFRQIAETYFACEGFRSPGEFRIFWIKIHRGHQPQESQLKYLHVLEEFTGGDKPE